MKLKLNIFLSAIVILIYGCTHKTQHNLFRLDGKIFGDVPKYIYLSYGNIKDSSLVENDKFYFSGEATYPIEAELIIRPISTINKWFYLENRNIQMEITVTKKEIRNTKINFIKVDTVIGTKTSLLRQDFEDFEIKHKSDIDWKIELFKKLNVLIEQNPQHRYSGNLLYDISNQQILDTDQLKILYNKLDTTFQSPLVLVTLTKKLYPNATMNIGNIMVDFELPDINGDPLNTKIFRKKVLLIDFWASWCAPCRVQNSKLLKLYSEFKNNKLEILSVSTDTYKNKWKSAIKKDNLTWQNVIDTMGYNSKILAKYDVLSSIPHNFLINEDGKIIAKDLSVEELRKYLKNKFQ